VDEKLAPHDFVADFVWAAREVFNKPSMVLVSVALWCVPAMFVRVAREKNNVALAMIGIGFFVLANTGWLGAQRIFFRRRREGKDVTIRELLGLSPSFTGRFLRLGIVMALLVLPVLVVVNFVSVELATAGHRRLATTVLHVELVTTTVAVDVLLTFVTTALVFSTTSAWKALRIGVRMIRQTWPRSGLYVLCPPLALNMLSAMYPIHLPVVTVVATVLLSVLALIAKGATAVFYLREGAVGSEDFA
jgi:hypothetical protein